MSAMKKVVIAVISAFAAFAASAKICIWTGGGGKWSESSKWENGETPAVGDTVDIRNGTADAVIENDISGLVLSQLFITGSASCTLTGQSVTLTDANAFSNGVAGTRCELPLALSAQKPYLYTYDKMVFAGDISAPTATELRFWYTRKAAYQVSVSGAVTAPYANIAVMPNNQVERDVSYRAFTFSGKITAASLFKNTSSDSIRGQIYLGSTENEIGTITAPYANIHCDKANVMKGSVLRFGFCESDARGSYRIWDYNQTIDRFEGSESTRDDAAVRGSTGTAMPVLTIEATADSYCPARFISRLSLVWAPKGNYTLTFGKNREHLTPGTISVKGGSAVLAGTSSFRNVTACTVADGAEFRMESTADAAFESLQTLNIGAGGKFTIGEGASQPFSDGQIGIVATSSSEITIPAGMTIVCASAMVDGDWLGGPAAVYTGWDNPNPGTARRLACLRGEGLLSVPVHARTCRWLGGGGKWSDETKWKNGGVPADGDEVVVQNDTASAVVENDIEGLSLKGICFTGSAPVTLTGEGMVLTDDKAVSNAVASTIVSVPLTFAATAPQICTAGAVTFNGDISGIAPESLNISLGLDSGIHTLVFNGAVNVPNANIRLIRPKNWNNHTIYFNGAVTALSLLKGMSTDAMLRNIRLTNPLNAIGTVKASYPNVICDAQDVMRGAVLQFGYCESGSANFDLGSFNQTIDRFDGTIGGQLQGRVKGSGVLTLAASADCPCPAVFEGLMSLVWAPKGAYRLTFTNTAYPVQQLTGTLTFNGGTVDIDGARQFPHVPALTLGDNTVCKIASTADGAFSALASLSIGKAAQLTFLDGVGSIFTDDQIDVVAAADGVITLPEGMELRAKSFKFDDAYVTGEGGWYTGSDNDAPGEAKTLACLRGKGRIFIPHRAAEAVTALWTGQGSDDSVGTGGNWQGGMVPDFTPGNLTARFAAGGERAVLGGGEKFNGIVFSGAENFTLAASGSEPALVYGDGIVCEAGGRYELAAPLNVAAVQTWAVEAGATLDVRGAFVSGNEPYPLTIDGAGTVNWYSDPAAFTGNLTFAGGDSHIYSGSFATAGETVTFLSPAAAEKSMSVTFHGGEYNRPVVCREEKGVRFGSFVFASASTNVFKAPFTFADGANGVSRPKFNGRIVFAAGLTHTGWRMIPDGNGGGTVVVTNVPLSVAGIQSDASTAYWLYAAGNSFGSYGVALNNSASFNCAVDWALNDADMNFRIGNSSKLYLNGHSQRIGSLLFTLTKGGWETFVGSRISNENAEPATLYFTQKTATTNSVTPIVGALNLSKSGPAEFAVDRAVAAIGTLEVAQGRFAFTPKGTWAGATNVTVSGSGELSLSRSDTFARKVTLALFDDGRIALGEGVAQPIAGMTMDGLQSAGGTWGSSASGAENVDDERFSGAGVLVVRPAGFMMIVR